MPHYDSAARVVCPFYKTQRDMTVTCEGLHKKQDIKMLFKNKRDKERHLEKYCECADYLNRCKLAYILQQKYEDMQ